MQKRGKTTTGTQRWFCVTCKISSTRKRPDTRERHLHRWFVRWLVGTASLIEIAGQIRLCREQVTELFRPFWYRWVPESPQLIGCVRILIVDAVYMSGRVNAALIGCTPIAVCSWSFAERECYAAWGQFFRQYQAIEVIVMDGQKGLHKAFSGCFPHAQVQRCLVHVERFVRCHISRRPRTQAGRELWVLTRSLWQVETEYDALCWRMRFFSWEAMHHQFLSERSISPTTNRWWYTHRKIRAARAHIHNALPYLFTFTQASDIPRTTNHVEGGINSRLKELIRRHRGLSSTRKRVLAAHFLASKTPEKPPRNST